MTDENISAIRARLRFGTLDEFIQGYARYVSSGGIFIPMGANKLKPKGTIIRFQFLLGDKSTALLGEGRVHQVHEPNPTNPNAPVGLLVKFTKLSQSSKQIIDRIISYKKESAGAERGDEDSQSAQQRKVTEQRDSISRTAQSGSGETKKTPHSQSSIDVFAAMNSAQGSGGGLEEVTRAAPDPNDVTPAKAILEQKEALERELALQQEPPSPDAEPTKPPEDEEFFSLAQSYAGDASTPGDANKRDTKESEIVEREPQSKPFSDSPSTRELDIDANDVLLAEQSLGESSEPEREQEEEQAHNPFAERNLTPAVGQLNPLSEVFDEANNGEASEVSEAASLDSMQHDVQLPAQDTEQERAPEEQDEEGEEEDVVDSAEDSVEEEEDAQPQVTAAAQDFMNSLGDLFEDSGLVSESEPAPSDLSDPPEPDQEVDEATSEAEQGDEAQQEEAQPEESEAIVLDDMELMDSSSVAVDPMSIPTTPGLPHPPAVPEDAAKEDDEDDEAQQQAQQDESGDDELSRVADDQEDALFDADEFDAILNEDDSAQPEATKEQQEEQPEQSDELSVLDIPMPPAPPAVNPGPKQLGETQGGLQIMAYDELSAQAGEDLDLSSIAIDEEGDLDLLFDGIFGNSGESEDDVFGDIFSGPGMQEEDVPLEVAVQDEVSLSSASVDAAPSKELSKLLSVIDDDADEDDDVLSIAPEQMSLQGPSAAEEIDVEAHKQAEEDSLQALLAVASRDLDVARSQQAQSGDDLLNDILGDDLPPPPKEDETFASIPEPRKPGKKGLFSKFFNRDD